MSLQSKCKGLDPLGTVFTQQGHFNIDCGNCVLKIIQEVWVKREKSPIRLPGLLTTKAVVTYCNTVSTI